MKDRKPAGSGLSLLDCHAKVTGPELALSATCPDTSVWCRHSHAADPDLDIIPTAQTHTHQIKKTAAAVFFISNHNNAITQPQVGCAI
ncbi:hypothetical protein [Chitinolyticbacter albus]|uniref:hypothetical protein n=1 Tax=Chitinolyticbacter albus TaxID=2961951 RepID=UPI00210C4C60|nr:hypothetical protein [Chitinolyticbacter albus]